MSDKDVLNDEEQGDDEVASEVPTTFATKGKGWSGRDSDSDDLSVVDLDK